MVNKLIFRWPVAKTFIFHGFGGSWFIYCCLSSSWFYQVYSQLLVAGATATQVKSDHLSKGKNKKHLQPPRQPLHSLKTTKVAPGKKHDGFWKVFEFLLGFRTPIF